MSTRMHTSGVDHHLICTHNPCGHNFVHSSQSCAANSVSYSSHVTQSDHTSSRLLEHERAQALASAANPVMDVAGTNLESKHTGTIDMHAHPCHHHRATGRVEARYTATCMTGGVVLRVATLDHKLTPSLGPGSGADMAAAWTWQLRLSVVLGAHRSVDRFGCSCSQ